MPATGAALPTTEALFEDAACGLLVTDPDGTILRVNRTFCGWLGRGAADLVGRLRLQDLLTMGGRIFHQTHWAPLLQMQGSIAEVKLDLRHHDGRVLPMMMNAIRRQHDAQVLHEISVVIATDRHQFERELIRARKHAEELLANEQHAQAALALAQDQLRQALEAAQDRALFAEQTVGIVSHDLRNPLAAVQMSTRLLSRGAVTPEQHRIIERIDQASRRAQRLIADLLDFTQARIGRGLTVHPRPIDLPAFLHDCVEELAAAYPGHELQYSHEGLDRCTVDPDRLAQLLGNLVSNAIAYRWPGTPVRIASQAGDEAVSLAVQNQGEPIPAGLMSSLFDAMTRGPNAENADRSVGLGLFIVRAIARAHRGDVSVSSTAEGGTTFVVRLPASTSSHG